jgi:hypothetical protein
MGPDIGLEPVVIAQGVVEVDDEADLAHPRGLVLCAHRYRPTCRVSFQNRIRGSARLCS